MLPSHVTVGVYGERRSPVCLCGHVTGGVQCMRMFVLSIGLVLRACKDVMFG